MRNETLNSCYLQEHLESIANLAESCRLTYINQEKGLSTVQGQIIGIYAANGLDWCQLTDGSIIRLDKIEMIERHIDNN